MKYKVMLSSAALADIEQATEWYESQLEGLGERMQKLLFLSIDEIESNPFTIAKRYKEVRVKFLPRFPYGIHFHIEDEIIKIVGFFHMKRDPIKWNDRLG